MNQLKIKRIYAKCIFLFVVLCFACKKGETYELQTITVEDFAQFIAETNYKTDAEIFGWSVVQKTVNTYDIVYGVDWRCPDGLQSAHPKSPVTQVSYNDALAYCQWANLHLPSYDEYWQYAEKDKRAIVINAPKIVLAKSTNIIGNTWDITVTKNFNGDIRLAGGSYLCSKFTCDGTNPNRRLFVSQDTGNTHISFSVVVPKNQ